MLDPKRPEEQELEKQWEMLVSFRSGEEQELLEEKEMLVSRPREIPDEQESLQKQQKLVSLRPD